MKKTFVLLPNLVKAKKVIENLQQSGINRKGIYLLSNPRKLMHYFKDQRIPVNEYTKLSSAVAKGVMIGLCIGALLYILSTNISAFAEESAMPPIFWLLFSVGVCVWVASLIGVSSIKQQYQKYMRYIAKGWTLLVIEGPPKKVKEVIKRHKIDS